jgi:hypothetical protein
VAARHLLDAAARGLGTTDLALIDRVDVTLAPVAERPTPTSTPTTACGCSPVSGPGSARGSTVALGVAALGAVACFRGRGGRPSVAGSAPQYAGPMRQTHGMKIKT